VVESCKLLPQLISIVGVDGSGKTTLIKAVIDRLEKQSICVEVVWSRFNNYLSKPLLALTRLSGHNRRLMIDGKAFGFHNFERLVGYREVFAMTQAVDVNLAAWRHIRPALRRENDLVVLERGPWDTLVDVMADTGMTGLAKSIVGRWIVRSVVDVASTVLIRRPVAQIMESRSELRHDRKLTIRASHYDWLAQSLQWIVVENDTTIETATEALYNAILSRFENPLFLKR
jgi:thymidylate kinase